MNRKRLTFAITIFSIIILMFSANIMRANENLKLLDLLNITPSKESIDYVNNKTQYQLHTLITEQRHVKTWNFSEVVQKNTLSGLQLLNSVDEDVSNKLAKLSKTHIS